MLTSEKDKIKYCKSLINNLQKDIENINFNYDSAIKFLNEIFKNEFKIESYEKIFVDFVKGEREKQTHTIKQYYIDNEFIFEIDSINRIVWVNSELWYVLEKNYNESFIEVRSLLKEVVCKKLNCESFMPEVYEYLY